MIIRRGRRWWTSPKKGQFELLALTGTKLKGSGVNVICEERGLCVGNTYFKHRCLHKYTRVARSREGVEIKNMIDLLLMKRDML